MNLFGVFHSNKQKEREEDNDRKSRRWPQKFGRNRNRNFTDRGNGEICSDGFLVRGEAVSARSREIQIVGSLISPVYHNSYSSETSFRISGEDNGQFKALCEHLGVNSPEDFAITPADLIAAKMCGNNWSVNMDPGTQNLDVNTGITLSSSVPDEDINYVGGFCDNGNVDIDRRAQELDGNNGISSSSPTAHEDLYYVGDRSNRSGSGVSGGIKGIRPSSLFSADWIAEGAKENTNWTVDIDRGAQELNGNKEIRLSSCTPNKDLDYVGDFCNQTRSSVRRGIKGTRPSSLNQPPKMSLPDANIFTSTWDVLVSLAPDEGLNESLLEIEKEKESKEKEAELGVISVDPTSSCSLWTSNDEYSSSTTPDIVSPSARCKRNISTGSWEKRELLGHGSFGSVHKAFSE